MSAVSNRKFPYFKLYINNLSNSFKVEIITDLNQITKTGWYSGGNIDQIKQYIPGGWNIINAAVQDDKSARISVFNKQGLVLEVNRNSDNSYTYFPLALKSDLYPSYNRSILFSDLKADVTDQSITITKDGMVQAVAKTQAIGGTAFVRFVVNNTVVYEGHTVSGTYRYLWTPIFPVKKGDVIKVTLETTTTDGQRFVYFYKS